MRTLDSEANAEGDDPLIVIASNRGPFSFRLRKDGSFSTSRGTGGLVTALGTGDLATDHDVLWIANAMSRGDRLWAQRHKNDVETVDGIGLRLLQSEKQRYKQYYNVISNPLLWFIQHQLWDTPRSPSITATTWAAWTEGYVSINVLFADAIADVVKGMTRRVVIFPQDYHFYLIPHFLRQKLGNRVQIQPFIHIPWPSPDAWRILPDKMRTMILSSLLASDRVGFQTRRDAFNFVQTCRFYLDDAHSKGTRDTIHYQGRAIKARTYPVSLDVDKVEALSREPETQKLKAQVRDFVGPRRLILRIDRIEPSKNILRGLEACRALLEAHREHHGKVQMLLLLVPSRMEVDEYQDYLRQIMAEAGLINAHYGGGTWEPVRTLLGDNYRRAIAAMQLYDVLLVNPIADGMNLVAKEGVLVNQNNGVLVLSEFAGAFYELGQQALTVSPFDIFSTAQALHQALTMADEERRRRAEALRQIVRNRDARHWFQLQLQDALGVPDA